MASIRGLDRASLEYPQVRAGLILMMDRTFSERQNEIIVEKAIRYAPRGIVGIDIAGPRPSSDGPYPYRTLRPLVQQAREARLGVTIHVGEEGGEYGIAEIREVVSTLRPDRIGHGILAARDKRLMGQISEAGIVLELCPTSNLLTKALESEEALRDTFRAFAECEVQFTIATDGPEMMRTHLRDEFELLLRVGAVEESQLSEANRRGHEASFMPRKPAVQTAIDPKYAIWVIAFASTALLTSLSMQEALTKVPTRITERQLQVIELIAAGCSNEEVGQRLGISPRTAKAHCDVLRQKLGVARRRQIPVAYRLLTGDDPLAHSLGPASASD